MVVGQVVIELPVHNSLNYFGGDGNERNGPEVGGVRESPDLTMGWIMECFQGPGMSHWVNPISGRGGCFYPPLGFFLNVSQTA